MPKLLAAALVVLLQAPSFEVASIKPNPAKDAPESTSLQPGGGVRMTGFSVLRLIRVAYADAVQTPQQIVGGPPWITSDRYDIVAKAEGDVKLDPEGRRPLRVIEMLKSLLGERFALKVHMDTQRIAVFSLTLRRAGPGIKLKPSTVDCKISPPCGFRRVPGLITARYITMQEVAAYFSGFNVIGRPIQDRTGLTDRYDFNLELTEGPDADPGTLYTALQEQLGLIFQREMAPMPVLVVDRVERPTPD